MGQRSQIYVKVDNKLQVANYYQWNYGTRMISRARYGIEWINKNINYPCFFDRSFYNFEKFRRIWDINFDYKDIVISSDILTFKEYCENDSYSKEEFVYKCQANNDGKLFINVNTESKEIKFAFTDGECNVLNPFEYIKWDESEWLHNKYISKKERDTCIKNIRELYKMATLMTQEEIDEYMKSI